MGSHGIVGVLCAAAALLGVLSLSAAAEQTAAPAQTVQTAEFAALFEKIRNDAGLQARWARCPADIYRSEAGFWSDFIDGPDVELEQCEADPADCYRECQEARSGQACFQLGRAFQENAEEKFSRYWETMFAQACAAGDPAGCTNRGAGIRNGLYEDDPFTAKPEEERDACLFATFRLACEAEDAWGCTMHGQSFHHGEGIAEDRAKAEVFYRKSCDIDPDFAACDYARKQMEALK